MPTRPSRRVSGPVALTGTPGVGKSSVARHLPRTLRAVEVGELARSLGAARGRGRAVTVDLAALRRALARRPSGEGPEVVVGHLAHLLAVREVILLRCHPTELERRLRAARRGRATDRRANYVSEATDAILLEALATRRPVFEIDTTGRSARAIAREVASRVRRGGPPRYGTVDWLREAEVTEHLLDGAA